MAWLREFTPFTANPAQDEAQLLSRKWFAPPDAQYGIDERVTPRLIDLNR